MFQGREEKWNYKKGLWNQVQKDISNYINWLWACNTLMLPKLLLSAKECFPRSIDLNEDQLRWEVACCSNWPRLLLIDKGLRVKEMHMGLLEERSLRSRKVASYRSLPNSVFPYISWKSLMELTIVWDLSSYNSGYRYQFFSSTSINNSLWFSFDSALEFQSLS